jgi:hypothetical protein
MSISVRQGLNLLTDFFINLLLRVSPTPTVTIRQNINQAPFHFKFNAAKATTKIYKGSQVYLFLRIGMTESKKAFESP